jgi:protein CpxP
MKKVFATLLAFTVIGFSAMAQEKREMKHHDEKMLKGGKKGPDKMMKELNLSDAQKSQVKAIREDHRKQMQALKQNEKITVKELNDRKEAIRKDEKAKMDAILTNEQKAKMADLKVQREAREKMHYDKKMVEMKSKLSLTDDQVTRLKSLHESTDAKMKSIKEDQTLNRESKKQQLEVLRNKAQEERKTILNADQLKKMEDMKKGGGQGRKQRTK